MSDDLFDTPAPERPKTTINALVTRQGVNMGDHGQDVTHAVAVRDGETVEDFLHRVYPHGYRGDVDQDAYVTLRLVPVD